jgi:hypothetical protein
LSSWLDHAGGQNLVDPPGPEALATILRRRPPLVVLHVGDSVETRLCTNWIYEIRRRRPRLPLVVVAEAHDDPELECALRAAGTQYYVTGESELASMIGALRESIPWPEAVAPANGTGVADHSRDPPLPRIRGRPAPFSLSRDSPASDTS